MAVSPTEIVFSNEQQLALLGHAIVSGKVYDIAKAMGVSAEWFYKANQQSVWKALDDFEVQFSRHPSMEELRSTPAFTVEEPKIVQARLAALDAAVAGRNVVGFDMIQSQLREWAKGQAFVRGMQAADLKYMGKDAVAAYKIVDDMMLDLSRIDKAGLRAQAEFANQRARVERKERIEESQHRLSYGVSFMDEATGGIMRKDLVLIGADSGIGKTELATRIASHNAGKGVRVTMFALEAEENEIERRIKYPLLCRCYRAAVPNPKPLDYRAWRHGQLEAELGPFEDIVNAQMDAFKTLQTFYRTTKQYAIAELERDIIKKSPDTDLFIIDHLHYIDTDGDDDNSEMREIMMTLRNLAIDLGKPIVLLAQMRKSRENRKNRALVPELQDFHGSSNITRIATTSIILAPCYRVEWAGVCPPAFVDDDHRLIVLPTFMRIAKLRLEGSAMRFCAIGFFDPAMRMYREPYALGRLTAGDTHWVPEKNRPYWAKHASVTLRENND